MTTIVGIDPGLDGGVAWVSLPERNADVADIPTIGAKKKRIIDGGSLYRLLQQWKPDYVIIEQVASMPKQGVSTTFKFGMGFGQIIGVVQALCIPHDFVTPHSWKSGLRLSKEKEDSRRRAIEQFPELLAKLQLKKNHNRAEALLIALWGHRKKFNAVS